MIFYTTGGRYVGGSPVVRVSNMIWILSLKISGASLAAAVVVRVFLKSIDSFKVSSLKCGYDSMKASWN